mmetsp:Transcript_17979/g.58825  ORF Transcript_17979/g.58825 Transcript_17979/m.58825 type:complete len:256 (+) Transcript_17979:1485-2252(+)
MLRTRRSWRMQRTKRAWAPGRRRWWSVALWRFGQMAPPGRRRLGRTPRPKWSRPRVNLKGALGYRARWTCRGKSSAGQAAAPVRPTAGGQVRVGAHRVVPTRVRMRRPAPGSWRLQAAPLSPCEAQAPPASPPAPPVPFSSHQRCAGRPARRSRRDGLGRWPSHCAGWASLCCSPLDRSCSHTASAFRPPTRGRRSWCSGRVGRRPSPTILSRSARGASSLAAECTTRSSTPLRTVLTTRRLPPAGGGHCTFWAG